VAADNFDLDAYLRRLSYDGPREPSLAVLDAIVAAHAAAIPYENIDVLLKRGARLDIPSLEQKLVHSRRGGYCFEQNTLLEAGLETLGFTVTRLAARNFRSLPLSAETFRNHKMLLVDLPEGPHIADVGLGNLTPTASLALRPQQELATRHETFRMLSHGSEIILEVKLGDAWESLVRFSLEPATTLDFEVVNWFTSTLPSGLFLNHLIVARPIPGGRMTVYNRRFTIRDLNNRTTRRVLNGMDDYRDVLLGEFGLMLDDGELAAIAAEMASHPADEDVHRAFV
jgi:N-hydroxyarylamine O-acetyltransferase